MLILLALNIIRVSPAFGGFKCLNTFEIGNPTCIKFTSSIAMVLIITPSPYNESRPKESIRSVLSWLRA